MHVLHERPLLQFNQTTIVGRAGRTSLFWEPCQRRLPRKGECGGGLDGKMLEMSNFLIYCYELGDDNTAEYLSVPTGMEREEIPVR
jgi:hypothetical protein